MLTPRELRTTLFPMGVPSSENLSRALADRLFSILPSGVSLQAEGSHVSVYANGEWQGSSGAPSILDDNDGRGVKELLEVAARSTLSGIQDAISRAMSEQWPKMSGKSTNSVPEVRVEEGVLHVGFTALADADSIWLCSIDVR